MSPPTTRALRASNAGARLAALLVLIVLVSGCALQELGREIEAIESLGEVSGDTISLDGPGGPTLVVLYALRGAKPQMVNYRVQLEPGPFAFNPPSGRYLIVAFEDLDRDFAWSSGEPLGHVGYRSPI